MQLSNKVKITLGILAGVIVMVGVFVFAFTDYEIGVQYQGLAIQPASKLCAVYSTVKFIGQPTVSPKGQGGWSIYAVHPNSGSSVVTTPYGVCSDPSDTAKNCCKKFGLKYSVYPY